MNAKPFFIFLFLTFSISSATYADENMYSFSSSKEAQRFQALIKEIRCVVCQNQSIADSNAPLANDLRDKIYHMVLAASSDNEIKTYLANRYGEFILLKPRLNKLTILLWFFPIFALVGILFILLFTNRQRSN